MKRYILYIIIIFILAVSKLMGQCTDDPEKEALEFYESAQKIRADGKSNYLNLLKKAIAADSGFLAARYMLAETYYEKAIRSQYDITLFSHSDYYFAKSINLFLGIIQQCPSYRSYTGLYYYADLCFIQREYTAAGKRFSEFLRYADKEHPFYNIASEKYNLYLKWNDWVKYPSPANIKPVSGVSTMRDELIPCLSADGELLFLTRKYIRQAKNSIFQENIEEFTMSHLDGLDSLNNWQYTEGMAMSWPFNQSFKQGGISLSLDKNTLYLAISHSITLNNKPYENSDIYCSKKQPYGWSAPENIGLNINGHNTWEGSPSVSADGKRLYFTSVRPDNIGGSDIYYSELLEDGSWGMPINLGPLVNTINDEKNPFIHSDNKTLYFSSNGKFGLGGFDIFVSRLLPDDTWSEPENLGSPINTENDETCFIVDARGTKGYYSSNKLIGIGGWDIFSANIPVPFQPSHQGLINGVLIDESNKPIAGAMIEIINTKPGTQSVLISTSEFGTFSRILDNNLQNIFIIKLLDNSCAYNGRLVDPSKLSVPLTYKIIRIEREPGIIYTLPDVAFERGSDILSRSSTLILEDFVEYLKDNSNLSINILGHPDKDATTEFNHDISQRRGLTVQRYLLQRGINENRLNYSGIPDETNSINKTSVQYTCIVIEELK